ncbi:MAG: DUF4142 domain-containing protein [Thermoanaerobaculia bacterium]
MEERERKFLERVSQIVDSELEISTIARERAATDDVRAFARDLINHRLRLSGEIGRRAAADGVDIGHGVDDDRKILRGKFETLQGTELDREYVSTILYDETAIVREFRHNAKVKGDVVRELVETNTEEIESGLRRSKKLADFLGIPAAAAAEESRTAK